MRRLLAGAVLFALLSVSTNGCRLAEKEELVGTYRADYGYGVEQLTIRSDGTYRQDFVESGQPLHQINEGRWAMRNSDDLWDPLTLELRDALLVDFGGQRRDPAVRGSWVIPIRRGWWSGRVTLPIFEDIGLEFEKQP